MSNFPYGSFLLGDPYRRHAPKDSMKWTISEATELKIPKLRVLVLFVEFSSKIQIRVSKQQYLCLTENIHWQANSLDFCLQYPKQGIAMRGRIMLLKEVHPETTPQWYEFVDSIKSFALTEFKLNYVSHRYIFYNNSRQIPRLLMESIMAKRDGNTVERKRDQSRDHSRPAEMRRDEFESGYISDLQIYRYKYDIS